jgi:hypothetical protein
MGKKLLYCAYLQPKTQEVHETQTTQWKQRYSLLPQNSVYVMKTHTSKCSQKNDIKCVMQFYLHYRAEEWKNILIFTEKNYQDRKSVNKLSYYNQLITFDYWSGVFNELHISVKLYT